MSAKRNKFSLQRILEERGFAPPPPPRQPESSTSRGTWFQDGRNIINVLTAVTQARMRARKPSRRNGERNRELESVELGGNAPPESDWLSGFQRKTLQDGTRLVLWIEWEGAGHSISWGSGLSCSRRLRGGPDDNFIFQGALNWDMSDLIQVNISFSYFSL